MATVRNKRKPLDLSVKNYEGELFEVTLGNGKKVALRGMVGRDLLFIEQTLKDVGESERAFKLIERLSVAPNQITFVEILDLPQRELMALTEALAEACGTNEVVEDEE